MENKSKYPIGGYAPGYYACRCVKCKTEFTGDKRAVHCEPCAIKMGEEEPKLYSQDDEFGLLPKQETLREFIEEELDGYDEIDFSTYERFIELGVKWKQEQICNSEVLQKIRASKSDAEARRIIRTS
jgi:hypothetical protein